MAEQFVNKLKSLYNEKKYFCNGYYDKFEKLTISLLKNDKTYEISFPSNSKNLDAEIFQFMEPAPFGKGKKLVYDDEYRKAFAAKKENFTTNLNLESLGLREIIEKNLCYNQKILLKLDKMNIYRKGGFFKVHKDTPSSELMIGTLIVVLPQYFENGDFILYDNIDNKKTNFKFDQNSETQLQWVAFFGDVDHEVEIVTGGNRITLTYEIILDVEKNETDNKNNSEITKELDNFIKYLEDKNYKHCAIRCTNLYASDNNGIDSKCLKGFDKKIYDILYYYGLEPQIFNIFSATIKYNKSEGKFKMKENINFDDVYDYNDFECKLCEKECAYLIYDKNKNITICIECYKCDFINKYINKLYDLITPDKTFYISNDRHGASVDYNDSDSDSDRCASYDDEYDDEYNDEYKDVHVNNDFTNNMIETYHEKYTTLYNVYYIDDLGNKKNCLMFKTLDSCLGNYPYTRYVSYKTTTIVFKIKRIKKEITKQDIENIKERIQYLSDEISKNKLDLKKELKITEKLLQIIESKEENFSSNDSDISNDE